MRWALPLILSLGMVVPLMAPGPATPAHPLPEPWFEHLVFDRERVIWMDMDLDAAGFPHLAFLYEVVPNGTFVDAMLAYARWESGAWVVEDVFPGARRVGAWSQVSAAVDPGGTPDLYFVDFDTTLHHLRPLPGGNWTTTPLGNSSRTVAPASGGGWKGVAHVLSDEVRYVEHGAAWGPPEVVDRFVDANCTFPRPQVALTFDGLGRAHLAYAGHGRIVHAVRQAGSWTKTPLPGPFGACDEFYGLGIAVDAKGWVHVAALSKPQGADGPRAVTYHRNEGTGWTAETAATDWAVCEGAAWSCSDLDLAVDLPSRPYVAYSAEVDRVGWIHRDADAWSVDALPSTPPVSTEFSLRLGDDDAARYAWVASGALRYASPRQLGIDNLPLPPVVEGASLSIPFPHVFVFWRPSGDDGRGENDVQRYEVWVGSGYDPSGAGYTLLATLPPLSDTYVHQDAGQDGGTYYYQVRAVEAASGRSTPAREQAAKLAVPVEAGWQLLSTSIRVGDPSVYGALLGVPWDVLRTYDASSALWRRVQVPGPPSPALVDPGTGLWVRVTANATWRMAGMIPWRVLVPLEPGWNLVGFPGPAPRAVQDALAGVPNARVEGFSDTSPYHLRALAPTDLMMPTRGYWVHVDAAAVWQVYN